MQSIVIDGTNFTQPAESPKWEGMPAYIQAVLPGGNRWLTIHRIDRLPKNFPSIIRALFRTVNTESDRRELYEITMVPILPETPGEEKIALRSQLMQTMAELNEPIPLEFCGDIKEQETISGDNWIDLLMVQQEAERIVAAAMAEDEQDGVGTPAVTTRQPQPPEFVNEKFAAAAKMLADQSYDELTEGELVRLAGWSSRNNILKNDLLRGLKAVRDERKRRASPLPSGHRTEAGDIEVEDYREDDSAEKVA